MNCPFCPYCKSDKTMELTGKTSLGYRTFRCAACRRKFNERTGTPFNFVEFPTDIVVHVVLWRLRYKLSLRDLAEMFLVRGFEFTHGAVRDWEARFTPLITEQLRARRRGKVGRSWYVDETYVKVGGKWCYLYRAIDRDGNLVDSMLSEKRDMASAKRFFTQAKDVVGHKPVRVTTDRHDSYPRAIRRILGRKVTHRTSRYLNNRMEQDHRIGLIERSLTRDITQCEASVASSRQLGFAGRSMNKETISDAVRDRNKRCHWLNNAVYSGSNLVLGALQYLLVAV